MTTKIIASTSGLTESVDTSGILEFQTNGASALVIGTDQNANFTGTTAITVPNGTTAQRPTPVNGMMRYNTTLSIFEVYANNTWSAANVTPTPVNTVAPVISGSAIVGQNLTCTTGTWSGSPSAYYYQWRANSTAISNATANVFTLTLAENGANITCNVTAYNVAGNSSPATSNTLGPVIQGVTANYLIVAGGGAGGADGSGGGGAGGLLTGTTIIQPANTYSITIGAGAPSVTVGATDGNNGGNTTFSAISNVAVGGGGGVHYLTNGKAGGSGGGAGGGGTNTGGAGTAGQGYAGGNGYNGSNAYGGGGGGAGQVGFNATSGGGGNGGNGVSSSISGIATYYAGGGGGAGDSRSNPSGSGGLGGGGNGGTSSAGTAGSANTGGGGGAGGYSADISGAGGSGVVIISYAGAQQFGGGVITTDGSNTIHTFTTSGSLVPLTSISASYLVVGGGGAGGTDGGGGGGAGGLVSGSSLVIDSNSSYAITVGAGGAGGATGAAAYGANGSNSTFSAIATVVLGGGGGGAYGITGRNGASGGGGSTASGSPVAGGSGTAPQGTNGGAGYGDGSTYSVGGGGGGYAQGGANATSSAAGAGGNGTSSSISGTATYYAGGGGGAGFTSPSKTVGSGGLGGGGAGGQTGSGGAAATSGTSNTGGGGGGSPNGSGSGGSGVVIISYAGTTPKMAGGNVTIAGNTVVHTFTASGYLTPFVNFNNSLRFRSSAGAYLQRTPTVSSNTTTWTMSVWYKRGKLADSCILSSGTGAGDRTEIQFSSDQLQYFIRTGSTNVGLLTTNQVFRDPAAWYHLVFVMDTTNATSTNRMRMYVNGIQVTSFSSSTYPSQNQATYINTTTTTTIGDLSWTKAVPIDGYMTNINFVDGQALSPYAFGNFNSYGVWAPVAYSGVYGTNGYYLPFTQSTSTTYTGLFNGSSYWASVADNAAFTLGTNDFTVEAWINSSTYGGDNQFIIDQWNSSSYGWAFSVNSATNIRFEYFTGGSYVNRNYTCPTLQPNVWYHIAWVRSSGTTTVYINGTAIGTSSDNVSIDNSSYQVAIGRNNDGGGSYVKNYLSNLRFVNGSAVYTSNFTPPTSPLTAVTNTQLLTLQSSTLVDNSPNAFSISNNGILMAVANPFTVGYNISADYSPQGNNWTPNNISLAPGSTYDSMVDVPTLTSANVANYCVLNPLWKDSSLTISNGNLNVVAGGSVAGGLVGGTIAVNSGKWYWETTCVAGDNYWAGAIISTSLYAPSFGNLSAGLNYGYNNGGYKYNGQTQTSYGASYTTGDVIGTAFDADAGTITFYKNNVSQGTAFTGITGTYSPAILANYTGSGGASQLNANFGQQPFKYTPPSGYLPLNTFNM